MANPKTYKTSTGRALSDEDLDAIADDVATKDYDTQQLKTRRRGRPPMGAGPAEVVPVRIDPELRAAVEARAVADHMTTSEVIREALRHFLDVA
jgi:Ribbon-helix-helix protein, copG family